MDLSRWWIVFGVFTGAFWLPAEANEGLLVRALDCKFTVPSSYALNASNVTSGVSFQSTLPLDPSMLRIEDISKDAEPTADPLYTILSKRAVGHLEVEVREVTTMRLSDGNSYREYLIRSRAQKLTLIAVPQAFADGLVDQCMKTVNPAVLAIAERRAKGCAVELDVWSRIRPHANGASFRSVFSSGKVNGWRIYGVTADSLFGRNGIKDGTLLSQVCGVSPDEVIRSNGSVCCASGDEHSFPLVFGSAPAKQIRVDIVDAR